MTTDRVMDIDWNSIGTEMLKIIGAGGAGSVIGFRAQKSAAKTEMVTDLDKLKSEYRDFADYTKSELKDVQCQLEKSREAEETCYRQHREALMRIDELDRGIRALMKMPDKPNRGKE
jgi:formiminotetrahydrofolate cyclodeaminase